MFERIISGDTAVIHPEIQSATFKTGQKYHRNQDNGNNTVLIITRGEGAFRSGEYAASFSTGDVFFLPDGSGCSYTFECDGSPSAYIINFKLMNGEKREDSVVLHLGAEHTDSVRLIGMAALQMAEKNGGNAGGKELLMLSCLYKIIYELYSVQYERPVERGVIYRGIKYIECHYLDELEIEEVARVCGMCLSLFYKNFKECTGLTPVEYKNKLKIDKAIELMAEKRHSLEDISKMLNFCNQSYFIRTFKRFTGYTPKQLMARR